MEQHSQTEDTPVSRAIFEGQLRESYGRTVYSHKTHEKCADLLLSRYAKIKLAQIILSALTTAGFVGAVFGEGHAAELLGLIVSLGLLVLNAYTKDNDLGELAQKHRQTALELWLIRESYLSLLVDVSMTQKPIEALQSKRDELVEKLHTVYAGAPSTTDAAYKKAQEALQKKEDLTFSDAEIDAFLPKELKRSLRNPDKK